MAYGGLGGTGTGRGADQTGGVGGNSNQAGASVLGSSGGNAGTAPGGAGGNGEVVDRGVGGSGGGGGADGTIAAPTGGNGGYGAPTYNTRAGLVGVGGGGGGAGGNGIGALSTGFSNSGIVAGGNGGAGGDGRYGGDPVSYYSGNGGGGGGGGAGIVATAAGLTISNSAGGYIHGGVGGAGGLGSVGSKASETGTAGAAGVGGAGIVGAGLTVINQGTIAGGLSGDATPIQADAIDFTAGPSFLTLGTTTTTGTLTGGLGVGGTLSIDPGTAAGTSVTLANTVHDYSSTVTGSLDKIGAGTLTLSGANTYTGGTTISAGTLDLASPVVANSTHTAFQSAAAGSGAITFAGSATSPVTLALDSAAQPKPGFDFVNTLDDFTDGDTLDLKNLAYAQGSSPTLLPATTGMITVYEDGQRETFRLGGTTVQSAYFAHSDGNGGTMITDSPLVCFAQGTAIRVLRDGAEADVPVEHLAIGDLAITTSGAARPIRWLGHRTVDCRRHPRPHEAMPVRIAAHALGDNRPARDLLVSPGHAICLDLLGEVLVPAIALVNGATITQDDVETVTYWHVELDSHDILLAENLPTESYLDIGNRRFFAEADVVALDAAPDAPQPTTADYCRPFHACESTLVAVVRDQLRARAETLGWRLAAPTAPDDLWLEVDGVRIAPARDGRVARAILPATAREVFLCSTFAVPAQTTGEADGRRLGVKLAGLVVDDGLACRREIGCDDPRLADGFYGDEGAHRWSDGRARLPAELWEGVATDFYLRIALAGLLLPRWVAPEPPLRTQAAA